VEVSWHKDKGAYVHIGKRRSPIARSHADLTDDAAAAAARHTQLLNQTVVSRTTRVYLGSPSTTHGAQRRHYKVFVDELEFWFADRDHIKAFGFLEDGKRKVPHLLLTRRVAC